MKCKIRSFTIWVTCIAICILGRSVAFAQVDSSIRSRYVFTPNAILDTAVDRLGKPYHLQDLAINDTVRADSVINVYGGDSSGHFKVHYEIGSGMDELSNPIHAARRAVMNKVLGDLSHLIHSDLSTNGEKIDIWFRKKANVSNATGLGYASAFYLVPRGVSGYNIADNTAWLAINSGKDPYRGFFPFNFNRGSFFEMIATIDFDAYSWNTNLSVSPSSGQYDLYSELLSEMLHALGIHSLINATGNSILGNAFGSYNRFDTRLKTHSGIALLQQSTAGAYSFNSALSPISAITPFSGSCISDSTVCDSAIVYNSVVTVPLYTPNCFQAGKSLSCLEDQCLGLNNTYYATANNLPDASIRRYPQQLECQILSDIGYVLDTTYGDSLTLNYRVYSPYTTWVDPSGVTGTGTLPVIGIGDGLANDRYIKYYSTSIGEIYFNGAGLPSGTDGLISNDINATAFTNVKLLEGYGSFNRTSGSLSDNLYYSVSSADLKGRYLIEYTPYNALTGRFGNRTYGMAMLVVDHSCTGDNPCSLVKNGEFNVTTNCGVAEVSGMNYSSSLYTYMPGADVCGWGRWVNTFDINTATCDIVFGGSAYGTQIPIVTGVTDYMGGTGNYIGLWGGRIGGRNNGEGAQTQLKAALIPGTTYRLSFWAAMRRNRHPYTFVPNDFFLVHEGRLRFYINSTPFNVWPSYYTFFSAAEYDDVDIPEMGTATLTSPIFDISSDLYWHHYSFNFTYSGPSTSVPQYLGVLNVSHTNTMTPASYADYIYVDAVEISSDAVISSYSSIMCVGGTQTLTASISGGTWSSASSNISLNTTTGIVTAIAAGTATVTYASVSGCIGTYDIVVTPPPTPILGPSSICLGSSVSLSSTPSGGVWSSSSSAISVGAATGIVSGLSTGTALVSYTTGICPPITKELTILPVATISGMSSVCLGGSVTMSSSISGGVWSESSPFIAVNPTTGVVSGIAVGSATITYTISGCSSYFNIAVESIGSITGSHNVCLGGTTTLGSPTASGTWSESSPYFSIDATTGVVTGLSTGSGTVTYTIPACNMSIYYDIHVQPIPPAPMGKPYICQGLEGWVTDEMTGGTFVSADPSIVSVVDPVGGIILGGPVVGTTTITYVSEFGCVSPPFTVTNAGSPVLASSLTTAVCAGTTASLSVVGATAGTPYIWSPSISCTTTECSAGFATPSTTTTYSVSNTVTGCIGYITVTVLPTPVISGASHTLCQYQNATLTASLPGGTWSVSPTGIVSVYSTGAIYGTGTAGTVTVSYTLGSCTATYLITNNLSPHTSIAAAPTSLLCGAPVTLTATVTGAISAGFAPVTYSWTPCSSGMSSCTGTTSTIISSLPASTVFTFTATNALGCSHSSSSTVQVACPELCAAGTVTPLGAGGIIPGGTYSGLIFIDNPASTNISISGNVDFTNATVAIAPGKKINIPAGKKLSSSNSHFYCCSSTSTWEGFNILTTGGVTGQLYLGQGTLVEDAVKAVYVQDASPVYGAISSILQIKNVVFNRNLTAIEIYRFEGTSVTTFDIGATIITSRKFSGYYRAGLTYPFAWPTFDELTTTYTPTIAEVPPYIYDAFGIYNKTTLKTGEEAKVGISLYKVGPVASSLYEGIVFPMLFIDNMIHGIKSISANPYVNNSVFSYCHIPSTGIATADQGSGIRAQSTVTESYRNRLALNMDDNTDNANRFYDCYQAVSTNSLESVIINKTQIYSTHTTASYYDSTGKLGIAIAGKYHMELVVNNNYFANIGTAIDIVTDNDYFPTVNIFVNNNRIIGKPSDYTSGYCDYGIRMRNGTSTTSSTVPSSLNLYYNEMTGVANGIEVVNYKKRRAYQYYNNIWLAAYAVTTSADVQFGIKNTACNEAIISQNYVNAIMKPRGTTIAYWNNSSCSSQVVCNNELYTTSGYLFEQNATTASIISTWSKNLVNYNKYGLHLKTRTGIGDQGSATYPSDNKWSATGWGSSSYQTFNEYTTSTSSTYQVDYSKLFVRATSGFFPDQNFASTPTPGTKYGGPLGYSTGTGTGLQIVSSAGAYSGDCAPVSILMPPSAPLRLAILGDENNPQDSSQGQDTAYQGGQRVDGAMLPQRMACAKWLLQYSARKQLEYAPELLSTDSVLSTFYNMTAISRFTWIDSIEQAIAHSDLSTAAALLNQDGTAYMNTQEDTGLHLQIVDGPMANAVVDNFIHYYKLQLQYLQGITPLQMEDTAWIYQLAQSCPGIEGDIVYAARAFYIIVSDRFVGFSDNCPNADGGLGRNATANAAIPTVQSYNLYPNPSSGLLNISQSVAVDAKCDVVILNAVGELVYQGQLDFSWGQASLEVGDWAPGMYILKIKDEKGVFTALNFVKQ